MSVNVKRDSIADLLRKDIKGSYLTVKSPDHPLLLKGPDILIGGGGNYHPIYLPTSQEMHQDKVLRSRYILSRLALPAATRHLLLHWGKSGQYALSIYDQFADSLSWDERQDLVKIATDPGFRGKQRDLPKDVETAARNRFSEAYLAVKINRRLTAGIRKSFSDRDAKSLARARLVDHGPIIDGVRENYFEGEALSLPAVKSLIVETTDDSFTLDGGVPLQKDGQWTHDLAAIGDVASFQGDPEKALRAAAFAGWALLEDLPQERQDVVAKHLRKHIKRRVDK